MPFKLGPLELVLILVIVFVIFGAGKLPQIFGSVGKSIRAFRDGQDAQEEEMKPKRRVSRIAKKTA